MRMGHGRCVSSQERTGTDPCRSLPVDTAGRDCDQMIEETTRFRTLLDRLSQIRTEVYRNRAIRRYCAYRVQSPPDPPCVGFPGKEHEAKASPLLANARGAACASVRTSRPPPNHSTATHIPRFNAAKRLKVCVHDLAVVEREPWRTAVQLRERDDANA